MQERTMRIKAFKDSEAGSRVTERYQEIDVLRGLAIFGNEMDVEGVILAGIRGNRRGVLADEDPVMIF